MEGSLTGAALDQLFCEARTHSNWLDKPLPDDVLRELYHLTKWGPTSANGSPARFIFMICSFIRRWEGCSPPTLGWDLCLPGILNLWRPRRSAIHRCKVPTSSWLRGRLDSTAARCRVLTTPGSTRSFLAQGKIAKDASRSSSRQATSSRISCATWDTGTERNFTRGCRAWSFKKRVRCFSSDSIAPL